MDSQHWAAAASSNGDRPRESDGSAADFEELRNLEGKGLKKAVQSNETAIGLDFLLWLSDLEDQAGTGDRQAIGVLASQLVALREGLDPLSSAEIVALSEQIQPADIKGGSLTIGQGAQAGNSFAVEVRRVAGLALTPEGSSLLERKVDELRDRMEAAKEQSVLQLMGRKALPTLDAVRTAERAAGAADASGRILAVLVDMETREERRAALPEAFTPPEGPADESYSEDSEEELLFTTPFSLLAAVDMELARFNRQVAELQQEGTLLPGTVTRSEVRSVLESLREDIYRYLDSQGIA